MYAILVDVGQFKSCFIFEANRKKCGIIVENRRHEIRIYFQQFVLLLFVTFHSYFSNNFSLVIVRQTWAGNQYYGGKRNFFVKEVKFLENNNIVGSKTKSCFY